MTGRGRPPIGPAIKIRLDPDLLTEIDECAKLWKTSRAEAIRVLILDGLRGNES